MLPIQSGIENPLDKAILESRFAAKDAIRVDHKMGGFTFEKSMVTAA